MNTISKDEGKFVYAILSSRWIEIKKNFYLNARSEHVETNSNFIDYLMDYLILPTSNVI